MKEFVQGTDRQFEMLEESLNDNKCHVYPECCMPTGCSKQMARIGFEKESNSYALFIDQGITYSGRRGSALFKEWLKNGTIRFLDFADVKEFLQSLENLY